MLTSTLCVLYKLQWAPKRLQQVNNVPLSVLLGEENWCWWSCMYDYSRNVPWHKIDKSRKTAWSRKNSSGLLINNTTPVLLPAGPFNLAQTVARDQKLEMSQRDDFPHRRNFVELWWEKKKDTYIPLYVIPMTEMWSFCSFEIYPRLRIHDIFKSHSST